MHLQSLKTLCVFSSINWWNHLINGFRKRMRPSHCLQDSFSLLTLYFLTLIFFLVFSGQGIGPTRKPPRKRYTPLMDKAFKLFHLNETEIKRAKELEKMLEPKPRTIKIWTWMNVISITLDGWLLSNYHCIEWNRSIFINCSAQINKQESVIVFSFAVVVVLLVVVVLELK